MHNQSTATTICNVKSLDGHSLNLRLADGQITPTKSPEAGDHVIDAAGADLLPPIFDSHVHLSEPGLEHRESLVETAELAAKGGISHVLGHPTRRPAWIGPVPFSRRATTGQCRWCQHCSRGEPIHGRRRNG